MLLLPIDRMCTPRPIASIDSLLPEDHTISLTATDSADETKTDDIVITVRAPDIIEMTNDITTSTTSASKESGS